MWGGLDGAGHTTAGLGQQDSLTQFDLGDGESAQFVFGLSQCIGVVVLDAVHDDASKARDQAFNEACAAAADTARDVQPRYRDAPAATSAQSQAQEGP